MGGWAEGRPDFEAVCKAASISASQPLLLDRKLTSICKSLELLQIEAARMRSRSSAGWLLLHPALA